MWIIEVMHMCFQGVTETLPCVGRSTYDAPFDRMCSTVLSHTCVGYEAESRDLRGLFANLELPERAPVSRHTHGRSAATRNSATTFAMELAMSSCRDPKFIQASGSDQAAGRIGTRTHHWPKDLNAQVASVNHGDKDLVVMIDVDYYLDMPTELARHPASYVLFTVQPSQAAHASGEYKYCFNDKGELVYTVSGGATYTHKVWNYSGDSLCVTETWCGITISYTAYSIERKWVDNDRQMVLLTPYKKFGFIGAQLAKRCLHGQTLERLDPIDGSFARVSVNGPIGITMSTAKTGTYLAATVSAEVDAAIMLCAETSKEFTRSMALSKMVGDKGTTPVGTEVYVAYVREKQAKYFPLFTKSDMLSVVGGVRTYQFFLKLEELEPCKASMVSFMHPLVNAAFVAGRCLNNDVRTVDKRVKGLQKKNGAATLRGLPKPLNLTAEMETFSKLMLGVTGKLHPHDVDEVYRRQKRPTQYAILARAENESDDGRAKAMQKAEAYSEPKDPRNITVMNGPSKRQHSLFLYAVYDALKLIPWYAFGTTPKEVAEAVAELCGGAQSHWLDTDFSRMDGRVNEAARTFENILMRTLFHPQYHSDMLVAMRSQTGLKVSTKFGVTYDSGVSRASGSPETSAFNTILTAFIFFLGWRMTIDSETGLRHTPKKAWCKLGIYGGDDGGTPDAPKEKVELAAEVMGQKLTCTIISRGEPGVTFLARRYGPGVWNKEANSCCDILRQVSKFHVTTHLSGVSNLQKLCEKSYAFSLSDSQTPIIGPLVTRVLRLSSYNEKDFQNKLGIWNVVDETVNYPNHYEDWMSDIVTAEIPDWKDDTFNDWLANSTTLYDLLCAPPLTEERTAFVAGQQVEVEGDIIGSNVVEPEDPPAAQITTTDEDGAAIKGKKKHRNRAPGKRYRDSTGKPPSQGGRHASNATRQ